jgi:hypothetical protein
MSPSIELHMITNCIKSSPGTGFLVSTYRSFCDTFGQIPVTTVWCDHHPNSDRFDAYAKNIRLAGFPVVRRTESLMDSYLGVLESGKADYLFVLEHDWQFQKKNIRHTLDQIASAMRAAGLYYLRFNKYDNRIQFWDKRLTEHQSAGVDFCLSNCWSGNPHILDREKCLQLDIPGRIRNRGRLTLERHLTLDRSLSGGIYGPMHHPPTITHTDGREDDPKPFWSPDRVAKHLSAKESGFEIDLGIVVPAYHLPEQRFLMRRFDASVKNDARPMLTYEILFVTPDRFDIETIDEQGRPVFNISKAYNAGIHYFRDRAQYIACADIDLLFPPGFLDYSVRKARIKPFIGRVRFIDPGDVHPRKWDYWKTFGARPGTGAWNVMTYDHYWRVGGFNEEMFGWGGIDTDFKQRKNDVFGNDGCWYDAEYPLVHVNHPPHVIHAPRRPGPNMEISNKYRRTGKNWLERYLMEDGSKTATPATAGATI